MVERKTLNLVVVGSIPTGGAFLCVKATLSLPLGGRSASTEAALAQLGERQTEDLKVPGSIPGGGTFCPKAVPLAQWKGVGFRSRRARVRSPHGMWKHLWSSWL